MKSVLPLRKVNYFKCKRRENINSSHLITGMDLGYKERSAYQWEQQLYRIYSNKQNFWEENLI